MGMIYKNSMFFDGLAITLAYVLIFHVIFEYQMLV